jgi:hypothetical protein
MNQFAANTSPPFVQQQSLANWERRLSSRRMVRLLMGGETPPLPARLQNSKICVYVYQGLETGHADLSKV